MNNQLSQLLSYYKSAYETDPSEVMEAHTTYIRIKEEYCERNKEELKTTENDKTDNERIKVNTLHKSKDNTENGFCKEDTKKKKRNRATKQKDLCKYLNDINQWNNDKEQKLLLARYEKENKEISELKHFKCKNLSKLPKDYKNPIEGYDQRIKRYNAIKNRETKPPLGKPSIDKNSKKIANSRLDNSLSTWERMYSYRNKHSNSLEI